MRIHSPACLINSLNYPQQIMNHIYINVFTVYQGRSHQTLRGIIFAILDFFFFFAIPIFAILDAALLHFITHNNI